MGQSSPYALYLLVPLVLVLGRALAQENATTQREQNTSHQCNCMEYWQCIGAGGTPYTYCNVNKVCCFIDKGAKAVGILPRQAKSSKCGEKGSDNGRDGVAEPGEWSWQVRNIFVVFT